jgi:hypothetical protein
VSPPEELVYQPMKLQIFQELDRQLGFQTPIPLDILSTTSSIITPLIDGEQEEEMEAVLYTDPFVQNLDDEVKPSSEADLDQKKEVRKND